MRQKDRLADGHKCLILCDRYAVDRLGVDCPLRRWEGQHHPSDTASASCCVAARVSCAVALSVTGSDPLPELLKSCSLRRRQRAGLWADFEWSPIKLEIAVAPHGFVVHIDQLLHRAQSELWVVSPLIPLL